MKVEGTKPVRVNNRCNNGRGGMMWRKILMTMTMMREVPTDGDMSTGAERTGEKMTTLEA